MKMYKITPSERKIETIEYNGEYDGMRPHLKYDGLDYACLNKARDMVFVNDMGLLDGTEGRDGAFWFLHDNGLWEKFVGDALLWGTKGEDNNDPSLSIEEVRARVCYTAPSGWVEPDLSPKVTTFDNMDDFLDALFGVSRG